MSPRVAKTLRGTALAVHRSAATPQRSLALAQRAQLSANACAAARSRRSRPAPTPSAAPIATMTANRSPGAGCAAFIRTVHPAATIHAAAPRRQCTALTPSRAHSQARHAISRTKPLLDELFGLAAQRTCDSAAKAPCASPTRPALRRPHVEAAVCEKPAVLQDGTSGAFASCNRELGTPHRVSHGFISHARKLVLEHGSIAQALQTFRTMCVSRFGDRGC